LREHATESLTLLAGLYSGSPIRGTAADAQKSDHNGLVFPLNGALVLAEVQYAYPSLSTVVNADETEPLARTYKLGFWFDSKKAPDQRVDAAGLSLADPASNGVPRQDRGDYAFYGVADRMIWRDYDEPDRTVTVFVRAMGTPQQDRNLIAFSLNAGLAVHEPLLGRDDDVFGIGMGTTRVGRSARALDRDLAAQDSGFHPIRRDETYVEVTYQYEVTPWLQLQPDAQYVFNPGGGLAGSFLAQ